MISKLSMSFAAGLLGLGLGMSPVYASEHEGCDPDPATLEQTGTFTAKVTSIGLLIGARWGDGVLTLKNGDQRKFSMFGMKALETGMAVNDFEGEVYNLKDVKDFPGTYYGASARLSVLASKGEGVANNARCVVLEYRASGGGLQVSAPAPGGVELKFTD